MFDIVKFSDTIQCLYLKFSEQIKLTSQATNMYVQYVCTCFIVICNVIIYQDYAQVRFDAYFKQKKLFSWSPPCTRLKSNLFFKLL